MEWFRSEKRTKRNKKVIKSLRADRDSEIWSVKTVSTKRE